MQWERLRIVIVPPGYPTLGPEMTDITEHHSSLLFEMAVDNMLAIFRTRTAQALACRQLHGLLPEVVTGVG